MPAISTIEQLQLIGNDAAYPLDGDYWLTQDIDASATSGWNGGLGFDPIDNFTGTFDGLNHSVTDLYISRVYDVEGVTANVALFGTTNGATIRNLNILDCNLTGRVTQLVNGSYPLRVAPVIGTATGGTVTNCSTSGHCTSIYQNIAGGLIVGFKVSTGFVGDSSASISNCRAACNLDAINLHDNSADCAGFVFENSGVITNCSVEGDGKTYNYGYSASGFCNRNAGTIENCTTSVATFISTYAFQDPVGFCYTNTGTITGCSVTGTIACTGDGAGFCYLNGLGGSIEKCRFSGSLTSGSYGALFVYGNEQGGVIRRCSAEGVFNSHEGGGAFVFDNGDAGSVIEKCFINCVFNSNTGDSGFALFGYANGTNAIIRNCYAVGELHQLGGADNNFVAGFLAFNAAGCPVENCYAAVTALSGTSAAGITNVGNGNAADYSGCYYDNDLVTLVAGVGGTPKTTKQMKRRDTFVDWDFLTIWRILEHISYPIFRDYAVIPSFSNDPQEGKAPLRVKFRDTSVQGWV